jgi:hypothetical protein
MDSPTRTGTEPHDASEERRHGVVFQWGQVAATILLILIGALCLLKYMGYGAVVSSLYGLPSQARVVATAQYWGLVYFWVGLLAEVVLFVNLTTHLKLDSIDLEGAPRLVIRGIIALSTAGAGTLGTAFLIAWAGKFLR